MRGAMKQREKQMPLDSHDVSLVKGMLARGDVQSDIAAFFGVNGGRISEINTGQKHQEARVAPPEKLPPPGPYMGARTAYRAKETLVALRDLIDETLREIDKWEESSKG